METVSAQNMKERGRGLESCVMMFYDKAAFILKTFVCRMLYNCSRVRSHLVMVSCEFFFYPSPQKYGYRI